MKFLEKVMGVISREKEKQDSLSKISEIEIEKLSQLNAELKKIEKDILSIPATLELDDKIGSEINIYKNTESLKIMIGYEKLMNDYFIACEDTTSEEYEYFENADSIDEAINVLAETIGKFLNRAEKS